MSCEFGGVQILINCLKVFLLYPWKPGLQLADIRVTFNYWQNLMGSSPCNGGGASMTPGAMPAGVLNLLVGPPMPDSSKGRCQTKSDPLVLLVGGWAKG